MCSLCRFRSGGSPAVLAANQNYDGCVKINAWSTLWCENKSMKHLWHNMPTKCLKDMYNRPHTRDVIDQIVCAPKIRHEAPVAQNANQMPQKGVIDHIPETL
eukprot:1160973-Pelagomonas_calceolata.AAC.9